MGQLRVGLSCGEINHARAVDHQIETVSQQRGQCRLVAQIEPDKPVDLAAATGADHLMPRGQRRPDPAADVGRSPEQQDPPARPDR